MTRFRSIRWGYWRLKFTLRLQVGWPIRNLETGQEFAVSVRPEDGRVNHANRTHSQAGGEGGDLIDDAPLRRLVTHDAAFTDLFTPDFELGFDKHDHNSRFPDQRRNDWKDFGQGNEGDVGDDDVKTVSEVIRREVTRIDVFARFDPAVLPQFPIQLAMPDINRDDAGRASLQQTIGKPAGRCADVEADSVSRFDLEMVERSDQFQTATADKRRRLPDHQLDVNRNHMSGLVQSLLTAEDLPRKNQRLRLCASVRQPTRHEQLVQALLVGLRFHFESSGFGRRFSLRKRLDRKM